MIKKLRIGALISGGGTNLQAIIDTCEKGIIDAEIMVVGSDNPEAGGLTRAQRHNIPSFVVDYTDIIQQYKNTPMSLTRPADFDMEEVLNKQHLLNEKINDGKKRAFLLTRAVAERALLEKLAPYQIDLLVLAGFMRNLTPYFIDRFNFDVNIPRIMNIHPALLPSFPGVDGYGDTFRYGCKIGGCTVHFIDYGEDSGPIISQKSFVIEEDDTLESIKTKGLELEWQLYPECIQLFAEGRLKLIRTTHARGNGQTYQRAVVKVAQPAK